jgi:hypothetical protein
MNGVPGCHNNVAQKHPTRIGKTLITLLSATGNHVGLKASKRFSTSAQRCPKYSEIEKTRDPNAISSSSHRLGLQSFNAKQEHSRVPKSSQAAFPLPRMTQAQGIVAFYGDEAADNQGRTLNEILQWPASELEYCHDYIQILFPLPERSAFNDPAPIIDKEVFQAFRARNDLRNRLRDSFQRILWFYGFQLHKDDNGRLEVSL